MCRDGITDLVRIQNGKVCCWPNQGNGHFGARITMENAPWFDNRDQLDQGGIPLAEFS